MMPRLLFEPPMSESESGPWTTPDERSRAAAFRNERRRREYLTWRALLRRELGPDLRIDYDAVGAPVLPGGEACISVSHCDGRVAVLIATRRCAVDIEPAARNFSRVADRYMTPSEQALSADPLWPGYVWCAKEVLYKYAGRRTLDLCNDLRVETVDLSAGSIGARIAGGGLLSLSASCLDGFLIVTLV